MPSFHPVKFRPSSQMRIRRTEHITVLENSKGLFRDGPVLVNLHEICACVTFREKCRKTDPVQFYIALRACRLCKEGATNYAKQYHRKRVLHNTSHLKLL